MLKLRIFNIFSLSFLLVSLALFADEQTSTHSESNSKTLEPSEGISVPNWLLEKPFRVTQKLILELDGSPEAGLLKRQSENDSRLVFVDAGHWRFRQELPFSGLSREILRTQDGIFRMTRGNQAIAPHRAISDDAWTQLIRLPHDLSKRWGLVSLDSSWGDWFEKVQALKEEYKNADGDKIRVSITKTGDIQKTLVILEGSLPHEDSTKLKIKAEWLIEQNVSVTKEELKKSLLGGA